jgi:ferredoxin
MKVKDMEIRFKKDIEELKREIVLKSVDLDENKELKVNIDDYHNIDKYINISPRCVRCNLCVEECPVDAIRSSNAGIRAKILDNCVKCEICAQSCPISAIYVLEGNTKVINNENVIYDITEVKVPHRIVKMEEIGFNRENCIMCGTCTKYCPTDAIQMRSKLYIEEKTGKIYPEMDDEHKYPFINEDLCVGCGSCANLCTQEVINLKRYVGPVQIYNKIHVDDDLCVGCFLCEENCPTGAIKVIDGKAVLQDNKCIRCQECTIRCPVRALEMKPIE